MDNSSFYFRGTVCAPVTLSHAVLDGTSFSETVLAVPRQSGTVDRIPILFRTDMLAAFPIEEGQLITVEGDIRSYTGGSHLKVFGYVLSFLENDLSQPNNQVRVDGMLRHNPTFRVTPFGREISDLVITTLRAENKWSFVPCVVWGSDARYASLFSRGDRVSAAGRMQSREYVKHMPDGTDEVHTVMELSCHYIRIDGDPRTGVQNTVQTAKMSQNTVDKIQPVLYTGHEPISEYKADAAHKSFWSSLLRR